MSTDQTNSKDQSGGKYGLDAIIYLPAIGGGWDDPSIEGIARRIANVVDTGSKKVQAKAKVKVQDQTYGEQSEFKTRVCTVSKTVSGEDTPILDVYGMDYGSTLTGSYENRSLLYKSLFVALMVAKMSGKLLPQPGRKAKSPNEKLQFVYGLCILLLLVAYMVSLVGAAYSSYRLMMKPGPVQVTAPAPAQSSDQPATKSGSSVIIDKAGGIFKSVRDYLSAKAVILFPVLIVALSALGVASPKAAKIKESLSRAATLYICLISYLTSGDRSNAIRGKLDRLIEYIAEKEPSYRNVHIIGYSFGSILALDALFPANLTPGPRFDRIDTLVTIGCPFDMVRNYYPDYFKTREARALIPRQWFNVYAPLDVLSSNFADEAGKKDATKGIPLSDESKHKGPLKPENLLYGEGPNPEKELSFWDAIQLIGFRSHSIYWGATYEAEITCFHQIIPEMYGHDAILDYVERNNDTA